MEKNNKIKLFKRVINLLIIENDFKEAESYLLDFNFIRKKSLLIGIEELINDYKNLLNFNISSEQKKEALKLLLNTFEQTAHILKEYPKQINSQLIGYLEKDTNTHIDTIIDAIDKKTKGVWLRPSIPNLSIHNGQLEKVFTGHRESITTLGVSKHNKNLIISGTASGVIKIWDIKKSVCIVTLKDDLKRWVHGLEEVDDNYILIKAYKSQQFSLNLWNIEDGKIIKSIFAEKGENNNTVKEINITSCRKYVIVEQKKNSKLEIAIYEISSLNLYQTIQIEEGYKHFLSYNLKVGHQTHIKNRIITLNSIKDFNSSQTIDYLTIYELNSGKFRKIKQIEIFEIGGAKEIMVINDSIYCAIWEYGGTLVLISLYSGKEVFKINPKLGNDEGLSKAIVSKDGLRLLLFYEDSTIHSWDVKNKKLLKMYQGFSYVYIDISENTNRIFVRGDENKIILWNLVTGEFISQYNGIHWLMARAIEGVDKNYFISSDKKKINLWAIKKNRNSISLIDINYETIVTVTKIYNNFGIIITASEGGKIKIFDLNTLKLKGVITHSGIINDVDVYKRGSDLFVISASGEILDLKNEATIQIWNLSKNELYTTLRKHVIAVVKIEILKKGLFAVSFSHDHTAKLWNLITGECILTFIHSEYKGELASAFEVFNHESKIVTGGGDGVLKIWDLYKGTLIKEIENHRDVVSYIQVNKKGDLILSSSEDGTIKLWDFLKENHTIELSGHKRDVIKALFINIPFKYDNYLEEFTRITDLKKQTNEEYILSGSLDATLKLWDKTGKCLITYRKHEANISDFIFLPKSKQILSISIDGNVIIWDLLTAETVSILSIGRPIVKVSISSDEKTIVIGEQNGQLHFIKIENRNYPILKVIHRSL